MAQPRSLDRKVVAITGAARGIGKATATALVAKGARVAIGDIDAGLAERTAAEIGGGTLGLELDVTRRESFQAFLDAVEQRLGPIDALVNNAGIMPLGPFLDEDDATTKRTVDVNVHGVLLGMKLALPRMKRRGRGHVVNIASQVGKAGLPGAATYCGAKHFVIGLSEAVRGELRGSGVDVSCVLPAVVNTELGAGLPTPLAIRKREPEHVAQAIVGTLERPRFEVWVPRESAALYRLGQVLPRRATDAITSLLKLDRVLTQPDTAVRRGYDARIRDSRESPAASARR